ncbi:B3 DOMAIN PLANT PROTEIN-RELATED [Salix koriyanagi]|uniref:B3 DOMAIN PLANT PROTEIN-RELATED n=1 Tax=Salix koriyanagi TaxID=2511006 RepID=A0A9Q0PFZ1_9ROSI|nr:B3 DOMAIN PLANT PROTEIN-RELATED [Salix koriyanagi]
MDSAFKQSYVNGLGPLTDLPLKVKKRIVSMEGKDVELVVEKQLYQVDMNGTNNRLSILVGQVIAKTFLKDEEKRALIDGDCLKVNILKPSLEMVSDMNLK